MLISKMDTHLFVVLDDRWLIWRRGTNGVAASGSRVESVAKLIL
jgi:hypothetical protein